jgi:hypothetical protein
MRSGVRQTSSDAKHAGLRGLDGTGFRAREPNWPITLDKATYERAHTQSDQETKRGPSLKSARRDRQERNPRQNKPDRETAQRISELAHSSAPKIPASLANIPHRTRRTRAAVVVTTGGVATLVQASPRGLEIWLVALLFLWRIRVFPIAL